MRGGGKSTFARQCPHCERVIKYEKTYKERHGDNCTEIVSNAYQALADLNNAAGKLKYADYVDRLKRLHAAKKNLQAQIDEIDKVLASLNGWKLVFMQR
ncbi:hypothetical protein ACAX43_12510 [Paraburkholderia sp. IW21]|uniref:hypothetical protein n=1 Tax=Paraburkholderia sp. IW21 TaxID=3242488 RepID=UPI00351F8C03